jgi:hypothetical protein
MKLKSAFFFSAAMALALAAGTDVMAGNMKKHGHGHQSADTQDDSQSGGKWHGQKGGEKDWNDSESDDQDGGKDWSDSESDDQGGDNAWGEDDQDGKDWGDYGGGKRRHHAGDHMKRFDKHGYDKKGHDKKGYGKKGHNRKSHEVVVVEKKERHKSGGGYTVTLRCYIGKSWFKVVSRDECEMHGGSLKRQRHGQGHVHAHGFKRQHQSYGYAKRKSHAHGYAAGGYEGEMGGYVYSYSYRARAVDSCGRGRTVRYVATSPAAAMQMEKRLRRARAYSSAMNCVCTQ